MTAPDILAVIKRADQRWATKHSDDPSPADYLTHLATAIEPHLQAGGAPADLDQQRLQLEAANSRNELVEEELDAANTRLVSLITLATGYWNDQIDTGTQVRAALDRIHTLLNEPIVVRDPNLERQLDEARAERDTARAELRDLQGEPPRRPGIAATIRRLARRRQPVRLRTRHRPRAARPARRRHQRGMALHMRETVPEGRQGGQGHPERGCP